MIERKIASVSQINSYIKSLMERDDILNNIWIRGEISNFKLHYSGHMYLSLKDEGSALRAVMFKGNNARLRFEPYNGMSVVVRGRVSVYERDGQYQVYIEEMIPDGIGELYAAYEQLKNKLQNEGLFDADRKKTIPKYPARIGVITSATGAAVRDIINVLTRRYPNIGIYVYPVLVQGAGAAEEITGAIKFFSENKAADVLIVGRGGGSIEDLWAFNEEIVARAVYECTIPVISAVGHETDFTICDFAADHRAPTPSAAAELAVPVLNDITALINSFKDRMNRGLVNTLNLKKHKLESVFSSSVYSNFTNRIDNARLSVDYNTSHINKGINYLIRLKKDQLIKQAAQLDALSPLKVLSRGYAVVTDNDNNTVYDSKSVSEESLVNVKLFKGSIECRVLKTNK
jgi:exodeoxyribonuclease VII large subunit